MNRFTVALMLAALVKGWLYGPSVVAEAERIKDGAR